MKNTRLSCGWMENLERLNKDELDNFRRFSCIEKSAIYANKYKLVILLSGEAKLLSSKHGKDFIFTFAKAGNLVLLDENSWLEITQKSEVLEISLNKIEDMLNNKNFSMSLINALLTNILLQRNLISDLVFRDIKDRLKEFLLDNSKMINSKRISKFDISMQTLASLLGAPRQNLSRALNELISCGKISKISRGKYELYFSKLD
ncbi:MAG: Crp/Fnr family transcriptional regulator [Campylobacter sp.]|nr:Crp/Fnr family transcriptional regulator [Campylobacter sp.]